eukprot:TRINITY_DN18046_c0_g1_i1.p1 TRINITY_DN18046_c0_g1~~TRINITY_DN18046_c0_g1_i1.p1  ORF type:complete len:462 (-),score=70.00 TRINITY_DN18046_c0_g1_i1:484-1869(-)
MTSASVGAHWLSSFVPATVVSRATLIGRQVLPVSVEHLVYSHWLAKFPGVDEHLPLIGAILGALLVVAGIGLLFICLFTSHRLAIACDCVRESCAVMFSIPSLLVLPIIDAVMSSALWILLATGLPVLLSTVKVSMVEIHGMSGIFRNFDLRLADYGRLATWTFACFWLQELVGAVCTLAAAHTVATSYFARDLRCKRGSPLLALRGLVLVTAYHLGSAARGSFAVALLRFLRWVTFIAERILCRRRDREGERRRSTCCCKCAAVACESLLAGLQTWTEFLSSYAYAEVALSSNSYAESASTANLLLRRQAGVVFALTAVSNFLCFAGSSVLAAAAGLSAYAFWGHLLDGSSLDLLSAKLQELSWPRTAVQINLLATELQAIGPELFSVVIFLAVLLSSHAALTVLDGAARSLLYCFLWDASDGSIDAKFVPDSFYRLVSSTTGTESKRIDSEIVPSSSRT